LSEDIVKIINEKTAQLITKLDNLEKENRKLKNEVDALEQYGRRSLIRIVVGWEDQ
jgi:cell division protein FtsB